ncbi:hypothetical protein AHAS_Ahas09G0257000 [Arachis hypogaea]
MAWTPHVGVIENLFDDRPPPQPEGGKQVFRVRMTWLNDRVAYIPAGAVLDTLRQYARCYLMMLIEDFYSQTSWLHLSL